MKTKTRTMIALSAGLLALAFATGCAEDQKTNSASSQPAPVHTPGADVDAEDYVGPQQTVVAKRVDPEVTKKTEEKTTCKTRHTTGSRKGQCKTWNYKTVEKVTDDADFVLTLTDGTDVDVDQATYDSYNLTDADAAADVFPRS
jgi:hypothetical protein